MQASAQIGPYQVLRLIKSGGQGRVYLGYDTRLQRKVALKLLPLLHGGGARNAQLREARTVASMHSERIVEIYDHVVSRHVLALVMEYVPGCDLEELLAGGALPVSCVLAIAADIAAAMAVARRVNVIHGDLKASNVLIGHHGRVKLADFGIAASDEGAVSEPGAGSLSALAPEQIRGEPTDVRTDLFALGCLIYRMLTGVHPFFRQGQWNADAVLAGEYLEMPLALPAAEEGALPIGIVSLVEDLLQVSPERRPANTHVVRRRLREVSRKLPLEFQASLTDFARPFFRTESPGELPLDIPLELIEQGLTSGLADTVPGQKASRYRLARVSLAIIVTVVSIAWFALPWVDNAVVNHKPLIEIADPELSADSSAQGILTVHPEAVRIAIATRVQKDSIGIVTSPAVNDAKETAYSRLLPVKDTVADERIVSQIECRLTLCLFSMQRHVGSEADPVAFNFQIAVFADASLDRWHAAIAQGVNALYKL